jgi:very-short-patch-repair endonuclease
MLWQEIRDHRLGVHFRRQVPVGRYILDFYCEAHHLGVEIDGGIHATQVEYDQLRDQELSVLGVCLLHFKSEEVETNLDGTLKSIRKAIVPPLPSGGGVRGGGVLPEELGVEEKRVRGVGGEVLTIHLSPDLIANVVEKGSIAIDGVSLTVAAFEEDVVSVALIPHTLEKTTLGDLKEGDEVNVETDVMMRSARKSI